MEREIAKADQELLATVILARDENGELLGKVCDHAIVVVHAQMQRGEVAPREFERRLAELQFMRDDIVSRAEAGQSLPNGQRLCYFTPDTVGWLRTALSAMLADPTQVDIPAATLRRLHEKFVQAGEALRARAPESTKGSPTGVLGRYERWVPLVFGLIWALPGAFSQEIGALVPATFFYVGFAYLADWIARRWNFSAGWRIAALLFWPWFVFMVAPIIWLVRRIGRLGKSQPSTTTAPAIAPAPTSTAPVTTTVVKTRGDSVVVINRSTTPNAPAPAPAAPNALEALRRHTTQEIEWLITELLRSWGFQKEQGWPTSDGGFEHVVSRDGTRALVKYQPGDSIVGLSAVRDLYSRMQYHGYPRGYFFTSSYGDPEAERWAQAHGVEFLNGPTWLDRLRDANLDRYV